MSDERRILMEKIECFSNGRYTYKDLKYKQTKTLEKILKEVSKDEAKNSI